jgi:hypothetical protein
MVPQYNEYIDEVGLLTGIETEYCEALLTAEDDLDRDELATEELLDNEPGTPLATTSSISPLLCCKMAIAS